MNARFWETGPRGNPVKITLRPGQTLYHCHGGPDDEGWHKREVSWTHDGDHVALSYCNSGRDCDGFHQHGGECYAALDELATGHIDEDGVTYPAWRVLEGWQRDHAAEREGY
jgi:hypothetical protein